jgi:hypothetical protein
MIEFCIDTRVDLKTAFPHGPPTLTQERNAAEPFKIIRTEGPEE